MVILAGYKTVKQALVNHAVEFGEREVLPLVSDVNGSHGKDRAADSVASHIVIVYVW